MKGSEARQRIMAEAGPQFFPSLMPFSCVSRMLQNLATSSLSHIVITLGGMLVVCGLLMLVFFAMMGKILTDKNSQEEKRHNARQARREVGLWRVVWIWLSVAVPVCVAQSLAMGAMAGWLYQPHPSLLLYAALGVGIGAYASLLVGVSCWVGDVLAEPQTNASSGS